MRLIEPLSSKKKSVLLVANWPSDVGYAWWLMENFWVEVSKLAECSNQTVHLCYPKIATIPDTIERAAIKPIEIDYSNDSLYASLKLLRFIFINRVKFVYLTDKPFWSFKYLAFRLIGVEKIIVHDHTPGERSAPIGFKRQIKRMLNSIPLVTADAIIAVTDYVRDRHLYSNLIKSNRVFVAKNGIKPFGRTPARSSYANEQFGISDDSIIVFTSGRANKYKQVDFILDVANIVINTMKKSRVQFLYCGDGPDIDSFKSICKDYALEDRFIFAGVRSDIREIAQSCHIGMQASKGEVGYSLSILEYMSAGLATLIPDNPSVCASVKDRVNGCIYKENDMHSASQALINLIENETYRKMLSMQAQQTVEQDFNLSQTNQSFNEILKAVYFHQSKLN